MEKSKWTREILRISSKLKIPGLFTHFICQNLPSEKWTGKLLQGQASYVFQHKICYNWELSPSYRIDTQTFRCLLILAFRWLEVITALKARVLRKCPSALLNVPPSLPSSHFLPSFQVGKEIIWRHVCLRRGQKSIPKFWWRAALSQPTMN